MQRPNEFIPGHEPSKDAYKRQPWSLRFTRFSRRVRSASHGATALRYWPRHLRVTSRRELLVAIRAFERSVEVQPRSFEAVTLAFES
jgi:hypothetical protein